MKIRHLFLTAASILCGSIFISCEDFLDREPESSISPEIYFTDASQLQSWADKFYSAILPSSGKNSYGFYAEDKHTDNQIASDTPNRLTKTLWKVPQDDSNWKFENIYQLNYFLDNVLPKFGENLDGSQNQISGNLQSIRHYIGEIYFLRALDYFNRYQKFGDFPIVEHALTDDMEATTEASKRSPRNEVARFILSDLDKAATLMDGIDFATTRINRDLALLLKSRVALYEGTFLKYFKGTAFVPNGEGWPGKSKEYNANYEYPSGNIDNEINFFLDEAMAASKEVAEKYKGQLTANTGMLQQAADDPKNPYYNMFCDEDLSSYPEVLLWRQYTMNKGNDIALAANMGNWGVGITRSFVQNFLMADGTPVYTHGTYADGDGYYMGDQTIADVRTNRDSRLSLFLKEPGQTNIVWDDQPGQSLNLIEPVPNIIVGDMQRAYTTGYALRKGGALNSKYCIQLKGYVALVCYRAVEALLNYMEASYERTGTLDATALGYWQAIRSRAGISTDIDATIAATEMDKEAENDWGAYSGGKLLTDKTLYNIRRERRCEMLAEALRNMDVCRWRAMDQLITSPYVPQGFHLWNTPMEHWYDNSDGTSALVSDGTSNSNVSPSSYSEYLCPFQKTSNQIGYGGFTWNMAHYLYPIPIKQFLLTSPDGTNVEESVIYQNPYWPIKADASAEK